MAQPAVQLYRLSNQNDKNKLDIDAIQERLQSYQGVDNCADIERDQRSFYTENVQIETIGKDRFLTGYIHWGSYGMSQAHHDVKKTEGETPIPATNATTKPFFFTLRDSSENDGSNYDYVLAIQLWGAESPLHSLKQAFLFEMKVTVNKLTNRKRLLNFITTGKTSNATLVFSEMAETNSDLPTPTSCEFKLKGNAIIQQFEQAAIKKIRDPKSSDYVEIQDQVAEYFAQDGNNCSAVKLEVRNGKRTKVVSFNKLDEGLHEKFMLSDLFANGMTPTHDTLKNEFFSILGDIQ